MSCRAPGPRLDPLIEAWPAGRTIHVIHDAAYVPTDFSLKVTKTELIASAPIDYPATARWAAAIHHQFADVDGMVWMSRQRDRDQALLLFGDRVGKALGGTRMGPALRSNDALRQAILTLALRVGIEAA